MQNTCCFNYGIKSSMFGPANYSIDPYCSLRIGEINLIGEEENGMSIVNSTVQLPPTMKECCDELSYIQFSDIKPVNLEHITLDELAGAKQHLERIKMTIEESKKSFVEKNVSWMIYFLISLVLLGISTLIIMKYRKQVNKQQNASLKMFLCCSKPCQVDPSTNDDAENLDHEALKNTRVLTAPTVALTPPKRAPEQEF